MSLGKLKAAAAQVAVKKVSQLSIKFLSDIIEIVQFANIHVALYELVNQSGDPETFFSSTSEKGITQSIAEKLMALAPSFVLPTAETNEYLEVVGKQAYEETLDKYCNLNASSEDAAVRGEGLEADIVMNCKRIQVKLEDLDRTKKQIAQLESQKQSFYLPQGSKLTNDDVKWFKEALDVQPFLAPFKEPAEVEVAAQD